MYGYGAVQTFDLACFCCEHLFSSATCQTPECRWVAKGEKLGLEYVRYAQLGLQQTVSVILCTSFWILETNALAKWNSGKAEGFSLWNRNATKPKAPALHLAVHALLQASSSQTQCESHLLTLGTLRPSGHLAIYQHPLITTRASSASHGFQMPSSSTCNIDMRQTGWQDASQPPSVQSLQRLLAQVIPWHTADILLHTSRSPCIPSSPFKTLLLRAP